MKDVKWICDREQCGYATAEDLKPNRGFAIFIMLFGLCLVWTVIIGLPMIIVGMMYWSRRMCPACRRGGMVRATDPRGVALLQRSRAR